MMETREELIKERIELDDKLNVVREKINTIDYQERFDKASKFVGKYYREVYNKDEYHRCFFVYGVDKNCYPDVLEISYWENQDDYFHCGHNNAFHPEEDSCGTEVIEIVKEEFDKIYREVQKKIENALTAKK